MSDPNLLMPTSMLAVNATAAAGGASSPGPAPSPSPIPFQDDVLNDLSARFVQGVGKKTVNWKGARHEDVFIGAEAVDFLCSAAVPDKEISRSDAVLIGEELRKRGLFAHHVYPEHGFMDEYHFYRYSPMADELVSQAAKREEAAIKEKVGVESWLDNMRRPSIAKRVKTGVRIDEGKGEVYTIVGGF